MNTRNYLTKSTVRPENQFRSEAIKLIGGVVSAREYIAREGKEKVHVPEKIKQPVREQYYAYRKTWTIKGVARFLIRYETNIRMMSIGGEEMKNKISRLIIKAKQYAEIQKTGSYAY